MATASYVPGGWLGLIRQGTAVVLDPATPAPLVSAVWDLLAEVPDAAEVLHAVAGGFGGPLSATPCFGIIGYTDSLRVFLRGDIDLTVHLPSGAVTLDGRNVTTWTERWLEAPEWFSVSVPAAAPVQAFQAPVSAAELPVVEGAVFLQSLRVSVTGQGHMRAGGSLGDEPAVAAPLPEVSAETIVPPEASAETVAGLQETVTGFTETGAAITGTLSEEALPLEASAQEPEYVEPASVEPPEDQDSPATELTSSYDHLWDKTVVRRIEDAAVRTGEDDGGGAADHEAVAQESGAQEAAVPATAGQDAEGKESEGKETAGQEAETGKTGLPAADREAAVPAPPAAPAQAGLSGSGNADSGLIDSVPWATGDRAPRPREMSGSEVLPSSVPPPSPAPGAPPSFPAPSVPPPSPAPGAPPSFPAPSAPPSFTPAPGPGVEAEGDHDGQTILKSDLPASGSQEPGQGGGHSQEPGQGAVAGNGPLVLARVCPAGHANPPTSSQCFTCGAQLPDVAVQVPRPRLGRLRLSTGELLDLDESLVIGRQPSVSRVQGGTMPRLVQVASPGGDISRSHVEVRLEGWHVMLCDLKATNGTVLVREGQPPRRLAQNEMAIILDGDIAELGDDVSLRFEEIL
ncbi:hypothetical protein ACFUTU_05520 [Arthrobacter sp. NPDC057388]|uniref:FHA domain-containing protein n=1 Tax=Arthrobacter sp. NPDC057388 TaxID=3346116 RepID=UPI00363735F6